MKNNIKNIFENILRITNSLKQHSRFKMVDDLLNHVNNLKNIVMSDDFVKSSSKKSRHDQRTFYFRRKSVLLTYSDSNENITPKYIIDSLRKLQKDDRDNMEPVGNLIKSIVVAKEYHESGNPHFHVFIKFHETLSTNNFRLFDIEGLKHPNWRVAFTQNKAINYVIKYIDFNKYPNPEKNPNFAQYEYDIIYHMKTAKCHKKRLAYDIINGFTDFHKAAKKHTELIWDYNKFNNNFNAFKQEEKARNHKLKKLNRFEYDGKTLIDLKNPTKSSHIYLVGPSNAGKTTFINDLINQGYSGFNCPDDDDWTGYDDRLYDFLYFEEFSATYTLNKLNKILDHNPTPLRIKCLPGTLKKSYKPFVFCSNYFPHELYHKVSKHKLNTFLQRIKIVYIGLDHIQHIYWDPEIHNLNDYNFSWSVDNIINNDLIPTTNELFGTNKYRKSNTIHFPVPARLEKQFIKYYDKFLIDEFQTP